MVLNIYIAGQTGYSYACIGIESLSVPTQNYNCSFCKGCLEEFNKKGIYNLQTGVEEFVGPGFEIINYIFVKKDLKQELIYTYVCTYTGKCIASFYSLKIKKELFHAYWHIVVFPSTLAFCLLL